MENKSKDKDKEKREDLYAGKKEDILERGAQRGAGWMREKIYSGKK